MAAIANYIDKLLASGDPYTASPKYGIEFWEDLGSSSSPSKKPFDNATVGAIVDGNLLGLVDTHNMKLNAATNRVVATSVVYDAGTETQSITIELPTHYGEIAFILSYLFTSNFSATTGHSFCHISVFHNGVTLVDNVLTTLVANEAVPVGTTLLMSNQVTHQPTIDAGNSVIITDDSDVLLTTDTGVLILHEDAGSVPQNYKFTATFSATGDGVRGNVFNFVVSALVLKR